jgi:flagellar motor switch protein FliN/FliY
MSDSAATPSEPETASPGASEVQPAAVAASPSATESFPKYTQNLLHVRVPVSVTLATKKQPIDQIVELAPGSLIQFEKSCEEMLELCVGEHRIARGLAVKVGEKFGLRINHLTGPKERFQSFRPKS